MFFDLSQEEKERFLREKCWDKCRFSGKNAAVIKNFLAIKNNTKPNKEKLVFVEGIWAASLLIKYDLDVKIVLINVEDITSNEALDLAIKLIEKAEEVHLVSKTTLEKVTEVGTNVGIAALCRFPSKQLSDLDLSRSLSIVILDSLEIPGNIGTIIRSCDGTDTDAVIICNRKTRITHPKLVRSSQGSCFKVPIIELDYSDVVPWLIKNGFKIILTDTKAERYYFEQDYTENIAIVMGSERYGISKSWYNEKVEKIKIPMEGDCDSLNVGIAATIVLYQALISRKNYLSAR